MPNSNRKNVSVVTSILLSLGTEVSSCLQDPGNTFHLEMHSLFGFKKSCFFFKARGIISLYFMYTHYFCKNFTIFTVLANLLKQLNMGTEASSALRQPQLAVMCSASRAAGSAGKTATA